MFVEDVAAIGRCPVIRRPLEMGAFQFAVLSTLRAAQLVRGSRQRVDGVHKWTIIAQQEVAEGLVKRIPLVTPAFAVALAAETLVEGVLPPRVEFSVL